MTTNGPQQPSFKTNVNRAKTKRWVEAKSYSYDGDDWGEADDFNEYGGYDEQPRQAKPTGLRQQGQSVMSPLTSTEVGHESHEPTAIFQNAPQRQPDRQPSFEQGIEHREIAMNASGRSVSNPPGNQPSQVNQQQQTQFQAYPGVPQANAPAERPIPHGASAYSPGGFLPQQQTFPPSGSYPFSQVPIMASSLEAQRRTPPQGGFRGPPYAERARAPLDGIRAQSMTSSSSSPDFRNRRDYSPSSTPVHSLPGNTRPPRQSSLGQQDAPSPSWNQPENTANQAPGRVANDSDSGPKRDRAASTSKLLPFVRPADIYKRMQEERERERLSHGSQSSPDSNHAAKATFSQNPSPRSSPQDPKLYNDRGNEYHFTTTQPSPLSALPEFKDEKENLTRSIPAGLTLETVQEAPATESSRKLPGGTPMLPHLARLSGFGDSFLSMATAPSAAASIAASPIDKGPVIRSPESESNNLTHQPSLGVRTAVKQASDDQIPPTPSSRSGSNVVRSNTESTAGISPIISRNPSSVAQEVKPKLVESAIFPIVEEPADTTSRPTFIPISEISHAVLNHSPSNLANHDGPAKVPSVAINSQVGEAKEGERTITSPVRGFQVSPAFTSTNPQDSAASTFETGLARAKNEDQTRNIQPVRPDSSTHPVPHDQQDGGNTPGTLPSNIQTSRAESPSKGRVRDLADKIESGGNSRRESGSSPNTEIRPGQLEIDDHPRNDRLESFRHQIPGGWSSLASSTPGAPVLPATSIMGSTLKNESTPSVSNLTSQSSTIDASKTSKGVTSNLASSALNQSPEAGTSLDLFAEVVSAGSAPAGASVQAASLDQGDDDSLTGTANHEKEHHPDMNYHPEGLKPADLIDESVSSAGPSPIAKDTPFADSHQTADDFPKVPPLNLQNNDRTSNIPPVPRPRAIPQLSTDTDSADFESDRLRKELVRELGPMTESSGAQAAKLSAPEPDIRSSIQSSMQSLGHDSMVIPSEYDSYWNESDEGVMPVEGEPASSGTVSKEIIEAPTKDQVSDVPSSPLAPAPLSIKSEVEKPLRDDTSAFNSTRPQLQAPPLINRFSWEQVSEELNQPDDDIPPAPPAKESYFSDEIGAHTENNPTIFIAPAKGEYPTHLSSPPTHLSGSSSHLPGLPPSLSGPPSHLMAPPIENLPAHDPFDPPPLPSEQPKLPAFREILAIKNAEDRIQAYNHTRQQVAEMNTGLAHWIAATAKDLPEHAALLSNGGQFGSVLTQGRNSGLRVMSHGNQHINGSPQGNPLTTSHLSPGNAGGKGQGQSKGKDILHNAGKFGEKANVAAKGFFAKGRSRFRTSGGGDKVDY